MKFIALTGKAGKHDIAIIYDLEAAVEYRLCIWQEGRPVSLYITGSARISYDDGQTALDFFDALRIKIAADIQVEERRLLDSVRAAVDLRERLRGAGEPMSEWGSLAALLAALNKDEK